MQNPRVTDHYNPKKQWEKKNRFYLNAPNIKKNFSPASTDYVENIIQITSF